MATEKYWAYVRDTAGDLIKDIGNFDLVSNAIVAIAEQMQMVDDSDGAVGLTWHVVEMESSTTVWIAGPGNTIESPKSWTVMDEEVSR